MIRNRGRTPSGADLALQGLTFLVADPQRIARFFSLTGLSPGDLKGFGESIEMQGAVLEYLLGDESLLLTFAAESGVRAQDVAPGHAELTGVRHWD